VSKLNFNVFKIYAEATKAYFVNLITSHTSKTDIHITSSERTKWNKGISDIATLNSTGDGSVSKAVSDAIASVVADAPESFDTLKEIAEWINTHGDSAAAMNKQIQTNTQGITDNAKLIDSNAQGIKDNASAIQDNADDIDALEKTVAAHTGLITDNTNKIAQHTQDISSLKTKVGTADISSIGDGTITGAIKQINSTAQVDNYITVSGTTLKVVSTT
jgi:stage V sporulation protein SpoVS